jgi:hypothetical protein
VVCIEHVVSGIYELYRRKYIYIEFHIVIWFVNFNSHFYRLWSMILQIHLHYRPLFESLCSLANIFFYKQMLVVNLLRGGIC